MYFLQVWIWLSHFWFQHRNFFSTHIRIIILYYYEATFSQQTASTYKAGKMKRYINSCSRISNIGTYRTSILIRDEASEFAGSPVGDIPKALRGANACNQLECCLGIGNNMTFSWINSNPIIPAWVPSQLWFVLCCKVFASGVLQAFKLY